MLSAVIARLHSAAHRHRRWSGRRGRWPGVGGILVAAL